VAGQRCKYCGEHMANAWEEDFCLKKPDSLLNQGGFEKPLPFLQFVKPLIATKKEKADDLLLNHGQALDILYEIAKERTRQDNKWGVNRPDDGQIMLILAEEVGEVARASQEDYQSQLRKELIQVAAVAVKWIETLDWRTKRT